jgi:hypothetical protein
MADTSKDQPKDDEPVLYSTTHLMPRLLFPTRYLQRLVGKMLYGSLSSWDTALSLFGRRRGSTRDPHDSIQLPYLPAGYR